MGVRCIEVSLQGSHHECSLRPTPLTRAVERTVCGTAHSGVLTRTPERDPVGIRRPLAGEYARVEEFNSDLIVAPGTARR